MTAPVRELVDLVKMRNRVTGHATPFEGAQCYMQIGDEPGFEELVGR